MDHRTGKDKKMGKKRKTEDKVLYVTTKAITTWSKRVRPAESIGKKTAETNNMKLPNQYP
jgi:hypothetical protein